MKKLSTAMLAFVMILGLAGMSYAAPVTLKYADQNAENSWGAERGMKPWMKAVEDDSNGSIKFETYFNSAYHNFMDRLRQQYTDITAGDLRICCLLRMNLSTKEIASLMNVSVRAIELRRYRLRKRLSLDGDTNLVDFLMNF